MENKIFIVFKTTVSLPDGWHEEWNSEILFVTQDEDVAKEYISKYNEKIVLYDDVKIEDCPDKLEYKVFEIMDKNSSLPVLEKEWEV